MPLIFFLDFKRPLLRSEPEGGGGGTPLYKLYRYVPPQRVWFLSRFGLKTGIDFDHYGLKSGMVYKGTTGAYKRTVNDRISAAALISNLYLGVRR